MNVQRGCSTGRQTDRTGRMSARLFRSWSLPSEAERLDTTAGRSRGKPADAQTGGLDNARAAPGYQREALRRCGCAPTFLVPPSVRWPHTACCDPGQRAATQRAGRNRRAGRIPSSCWRIGHARYDDDGFGFWPKPDAEHSHTGLGYVRASTGHTLITVKAS